MAMRPHRRRGGLLVLIGFLTMLALTFGAGVYLGRIWMARAGVTVARVSEPEPARRGGGRGVKPPETPASLVTTPPAASAAVTAAQRPGEQADMLAAPTTPRTAASAAPRFTVQVASYRMRPQAEALRESLASAGHDARVVEGDARGPVYRVQVGEFPTREAARAMAARLSGERSSVAPIVTTR